MTFNDQGRNALLLRSSTLCCLAVLACALMAAAAAPAADGPKAAPPAKIPFPKPDTHRGDWLRYHGRTVELTVNVGGQAGNACLICHDRNDCTTCHNERLPKDHTNFWRTRGHGLTAAGNPERCQNCHRQDFCVACHNETAPRNHSAGRWNAITQTGTPDRPAHCTWCHFGSGTAPADNCIVCHKRAPHTSAPHPVSGSLNCSLCH